VEDMIDNPETLRRLVEVGSLAVSQEFKLQQQRMTKLV
jgi:hypothetical protein